MNGTSRLVAILVLLALVVACADGSDANPTPSSNGGDFITAAEALAHVGSRETVCGLVASATYASGSRGQPTFLNLDEPYPNQVFTIVIWGDYRDDFPRPPEAMYAGQDVCVSGLISVYRGVPQIQAASPSQFSLR